MATTKMYLEITDHYLFLSQLKSENDKFLFYKPTKIELNNLELYNETLFNLSAIYLHIQNFLKANKLKHPLSLISMPSLGKKQGLEQQLNILQLALNATKSNLKIQKIIGVSLMGFSNFFYKQDLENQLDFFKTIKIEQNKHPKNWIISSMGTLIFLIIFLCFIQSKQNKKLDLLVNQNLEIAQTNKDLEAKLKELHKIEAANKTSKEKLTTIKTIYSKNDDLTKLLKCVALTIPSNSYLSKLSITYPKNPTLNSAQASQTQNENSNKILTLQGITSNEQEIPKFLKNLSKNHRLSNLKIVKIRQIKAEQAFLYNFNISAEFLG